MTPVLFIYCDYYDSLLLFLLCRGSLEFKRSAPSILQQLRKVGLSALCVHFLIRFRSSFISILLAQLQGIGFGDRNRYQPSWMMCVRMLVVDAFYRVFHLSWTINPQPRGVEFSLFTLKLLLSTMQLFLLFVLVTLSGFIFVPLYIQLQNGCFGRVFESGQFLSL